MTICVNVLYTGRVQGVGFRYTAHRISKRHAVVGFVRNLSDGRVELVAQGEPENVSGFLAQVRDAMRENIERVQETTQLLGDYTSFDIQR